MYATVTSWASHCAVLGPVASNEVGQDPLASSCTLELGGWAPPQMLPLPPLGRPPHVTQFFFCSSLGSCCIADPKSCLWCRCRRPDVVFVMDFEAELIWLAFPIGFVNRFGWFRFIDLWGIDQVRQIDSISCWCFFARGLLNGRLFAFACIPPFFLFRDLLVPKPAWSPFSLDVLLHKKHNMIHGDPGRPISNPLDPACLR